VTKQFIFSWDNTGIEGIVDITDDMEALQEVERTIAWHKLKDPDADPGKEANVHLSQIIHIMTLRARFNTHRHYDIYTISCCDDFDKEFWEQSWRDYPQDTADLVRERGTRIYSDRVTKSPVIT
jgi:hypothetical protein